MKVLLNQDIDRLGRMGEVVEVAHGYARNYLIPGGLAVGVTRGKLKGIQEQKRVLEIKAARRREKLEGIAEKIKSRRIIVKSRCSATGKLFGSITNRHLASEIEELTGEEVDRHNIIIDDRVRAVGVYHALVKLHPDVEIDLEFEVEGEGFVPEEPPAEEEEGLEAPEVPEVLAQVTGEPDARAAAQEVPVEPAREVESGEPAVGSGPGPEGESQATTPGD